MSTGSKRTRKGRRAVVLTGVTFVVIAGTALMLSWDQLRFWWLFESLGPNGHGYAEYRHRETGIVMVRIPGGTFMMGSPQSEPGRSDNEGPVHEVSLSPFLLAKFELSQVEWRTVMPTARSLTSGEHLPMQTLSWEDCREFSSESGLLLPTEAQWEYACRAGTTAEYGTTGVLDDVAWYRGNWQGTEPHARGQKEPNGFGLHDMHGNMNEWCQDSYASEFYSQPEASRADPVNAAGSRFRVYRGGFWLSKAEHCRSAFRAFGPASQRRQDLGLRPAYYPLP